MNNKLTNNIPDEPALELFRLKSLNLLPVSKIVYMSVLVKNVTKFYGTQKALDEVSFEIKSGEIVGFLGPNGAGKSTMMKIITGFIPCSSGEVFVKGIDIVQNSMGARKLIGYLPENNPLYTEMYVKEYLSFVAGISGMKKDLSRHIDNIISLTGLEPERKKTIGQLSKGYRQRVGLAQALLHDPEVLILDEPTTGLDPNQIIEIRNLIKEVGSRKTVMLSTHIMQEVEAICDRVIIVHQGKIVMDGKASEVRNAIFQESAIVTVEFDKPVDDSSFSSIKGIKSSVKISENTWEFAGESDKQMRENLFRFAVEKDLVVLSMQKKEKRLEDVFRELTT